MVLSFHRLTSETKATARAVLEKVLDAVGLGTPAGGMLRLSLARATSLAQTWFVDANGRPLVLKVHPIDLQEHLLGDPDPRFTTVARTLPVAPYFAATEQRVAVVRAAAPVEVPRVLAEGRLDDGTRYTLMTRLRGSPRAPSSADRARLSTTLGRLARALHEAAVPSDDGPPRWSDACAEILHCVVDHLPAAVAGQTRQRFSLHARVDRILCRLRGAELGRRVLAHGDLHPTNLRFGTDGEVCGIVDFDLACPGPAALDFRWLCLLDAEPFFAAYGGDPGRVDEACWLGHFVDLLWTALGLAIMHRHLRTHDDAAFWLPRSRQMHYLLRLLENDRLRRGPPSQRHAAARRIEHTCAKRLRVTPVAQ